MMEKMPISGEKISELVRDLCRQKDNKPMSYYLSKYGISYEDYQPLSYAALPAMGYRSQALYYKNKLSMLVKSVRSALRAGHSLAENVPDMDYVLDKIGEACAEAMKPGECEWMK